jgi:hypothetical protein
MKTKLLSLTLQETPSKMLCPPHPYNLFTFCRRSFPSERQKCWTSLQPLVQEVLWLSVVQKYLSYSCYALRRFKPAFLERKISCRLTNSLRRKSPKQNQRYLYKKKALRSAKTSNSKNTSSGKWDEPCKNLVVFVTSLTFPPKNPPAVEPVQNPKTIRAKNLLINDQPINTNNSFTPNQNNLTTKGPITNLPNPIGLSSQNPNKNLT